MVSHSNELYANEIRDKVFPKLLCIDDLEAAFVRGGAATGASASAEYTAPVDDNDDDSEHNAKTSKGGL